eukprot:5382387-Amphidinium_carterae.1
MSELLLHPLPHAANVSLDKVKHRVIDHWQVTHLITYERLDLPRGCCTWELLLDDEGFGAAASDLDDGNDALLLEDLFTYVIEFLLMQRTN